MTKLKRSFIGLSVSLISLILLLYLRWDRIQGFIQEIKAIEWNELALNLVVALAIALILGGILYAVGNWPSKSPKQENSNNN